MRKPRSYRYPLTNWAGRPRATCPIRGDAGLCEMRLSIARLFFFSEEKSHPKLTSPPSSCCSSLLSLSLSLLKRAHRRLSLPPYLSLSSLRDSPPSPPFEASSAAPLPSNFSFERESPPGRLPTSKSKEQQEEQKRKKREKEEPRRPDQKVMPTTISDADHSRWRAGAPLLYDWLSNQSLLWPSLSCR